MGRKTVKGGEVRGKGIKVEGKGMEITERRW